MRLGDGPHPNPPPLGEGAVSSPQRGEVGRGSSSDRHIAHFFDAYLVVDWSARSAPSPARPSRDAIWVGEGGAASDSGPRETYWRTRNDCMAYLRERLAQHVGAGRRVLLGFDFAFGYPRGYRQALGLSGDEPDWAALWKVLFDLVEGAADNGNNRFEVASKLNQLVGFGPGPFWGLPRAMQIEGVAPTSPGFPFGVGSKPGLERLRLTDRALRGVQPVWKLYGTGSVGSQTLLGIPALHHLRNDPTLAATMRVWPFESGFSALPDVRPLCILAEVWPGIVPTLDPSVTIRDQAQVRATVAWLADLDHRGHLEPLFGPPLGLDRVQLAACLAEEGWTLGAVPRTDRAGR